MEIHIRQEEPKDYTSVFNLITEAFKTEVLSDHREQFLVERLRVSEAFIPELSLVAELNSEIIGHIILSKINIKNDQKTFESLALAPVSVLPKYQGNGIGGLLIKTAHKIAKALNYSSIVLLGHENYYPSFGYQQANTFGINLPFDVPKENCMAIELIENGLDGVFGTVEYSTAFSE